MVSFGMTDKGVVRHANQDSFCTQQIGNKTLAVVCDGIGGNKAGEIASALSVSEMLHHFSNDAKGNIGLKWFKKTVEAVNEAIYQRGNEVEEYKGMGTTLVATLVTSKSTYVVNVGDSRCYLLDKDNNLVQVTEDHTLINYLIKTRGISAEVANKMVGKNVIARAIGIGEAVEVDGFEIKDDYKCLLLCSDGLHGYVSDQEIAKVLKSRSSIENKCAKLVEKANKAGGYDNITVVICQR